MPTRTQPRHRPARQAPARARGFTLIELLVSLTVGIAILLGLTMLLARNSGNQQDLEGTVRQLESARFALDAISEDVMHAGYYSDFSPDTLEPAPAWQTPDPCSTGLAAQGWNTAVTPVRIPVPIQGIAAATALGCLADRHRLAGTEALVVRHAETGPTIPIDRSRTDNLYIQIGRCGTEAQRLLVAARPAAGPPAETFKLKRPNCVDPNDAIRRVSQRIYFVSACSDCVAKDGVPTLKRVEMIDGTLRTTSIAEGIENLQIEYVLDTDKDAVPNATVTVGGVDYTGGKTWENVIAVRVHLLARGDRANSEYKDTRTYVLGAGVQVASPGDGFKRTVMSSTVRLFNVSGRRE